ncbi:GIN domain-containing protein [Sphingobacterium paludis]|uniref:Putative autotransporter adhesin-like protein n=1 Tax=Sphingobacterium paludis TaxID=1476465 RepID=A0A4R7CV08_9SPHI|nr:DUF2807 domain-containing protein [Sphingobacterium paludis]TDS11662.1 putative autotransporter adhesin-like protein [Sphingobacterium paludis]
MKKLLTLVFILSMMLARGQHKETRSIPSLKGITVSSSIKATYVQSNRNEVVVDVEERGHLNKLQTGVEHGTLIIRYAPNSNIRTRQANRVTIYTSSLSLEKIKVTSSAELHIEAPIKSSKAQIEVNSSGKLYASHLVADNASIKTSSSGRFDAKITAASVTIDASSSAKINLLGSASSASIAISSSAEANLSKLKIKHAVVEASSSAKATVDVRDNLAAKASSSGKIIYVEKPSRLTVDKSSGGSVRQQ